jgi:hypothetical protein
MNIKLFTLCLGCALSGLVAGGGALAAETAGAGPAAVEGDAQHKLTSQDKLLFRVREDPIIAPAEEVFVKANGNVEFRYSRGADDVITLSVRGKTLAEVKSELKVKLDAEYYHNATVELKLKDQSPRKGHVLFTGAVGQNFIELFPGEEKTIYEGVYAAGPNKFANLEKVRHTRLDPVTGKPVTRVFDIKAIRKGDRSQDILLKDGDRIEIVEKNLNIFSN